MKKKKNFVNKVYINDLSINNIIKLELNYMKNNSILIRNVSINKNNLNSILNKLKNKGFKIILSDFLKINEDKEQEKIKKSENKCVETPKNISQDLIFNSFKNSFSQHFY